MYLGVKEVKPIDNYKLILTFGNNEVKIFDMIPYLDKMIFQELKEKNLFKSVKVSVDSIKWPNEADIDPKTLYEDSISYSN